MALNLTSVKDEVRKYLKDSFSGQGPYEQAIPDASTLPRNAQGGIDPYLSFRFGDLQRTYGGGRGLIGVRADDYELPIYFEAVAGNSTDASKLADLVVEAFLGKEFTNTGEARKRPGGGMFPVVSTNGATEAYMFPASFAITIQLMET